MLRRFSLRCPRQSYLERAIMGTWSIKAVVVPFYATKEQRGSRRKAPLILNLALGRFMSGNHLQHPPNRRLGCSGVGGGGVRFCKLRRRAKSLAPAGTRTIRYVAYSIYLPSYISSRRKDKVTLFERILYSRHKSVSYWSRSNRNSLALQPLYTSVGSRSAQGTLWASSRYAHDQLTVRTRSAQSKLTISSR